MLVVTQVLSFSSFSLASCLNAAEKNLRKGGGERSLAYVLKTRMRSAGYK